jgi:ferredoxin
MMSVKVKFISTVEVKNEKKVSKAAKEGGIRIEYPCDGDGKCGRCIIKILEGKLTDPTEREIMLLGKERLNEGYRLACQARILEDSVLQVINASKR